jgi:hypothetical protein
MSSDFTCISTVNSRGLAQLCEHYPFYNNYKLFQSDTKNKMKTSFYNNINDNDRVYVITSELPWFIENVLPSIDCRFNLLTGSAVTGPYEEIGFKKLYDISEDNRIKFWFSQNIDFNFEQFDKFFQIPLGVDFHKEASKKTPYQQEKEMFSIQSNLSSFQKRPQISICNFHHLLHIGNDPLCRLNYLPKNTSDRNECLKYSSIKKLPKQPRINYWKEHEKGKWVHSPMGKGQDCHRTYEAIALNSVPIVNSNTFIHPMFHDMPVKIVDEWSTQVINDVQPNPENKKMKLEYWNVKTKG